MRLTDRVPTPIRSATFGVVLSVVFVWLLLGAPVPAQPPAPSIHYVYDDLGYLTAVIDQQGNVATYRYDAVGNILGIGRVNVDELPNDPVLITWVSPMRGRAETRVEIFGRGFSAEITQNTVTFNGRTATVTEAATNRLVTSVPAGATTGPITVRSPRGSATSRTPFTVGGAIAISPPTVRLNVGARQQFQATEDGRPADVMWAVNGITDGEPTVGLISDGLYTAPARVPADTTVTVTATQREDRRSSASAHVTIVAAPAALAQSQSVSVRVTERPPTEFIESKRASFRVAELTAGFASASPVAFSLAPVITAVAPSEAPQGMRDLSVTLTGAGFAEATALTFFLTRDPDPTITVADLRVNDDGSEATAQISIADNAELGARVVQITTPAGSSTRAGTAGNRFRVTAP